MHRTALVLAITGCFAGGVHAQGLAFDAPLSTALVSDIGLRAFSAADRVVPRFVNDFRIAAALGPTVALIDTGANIQHVMFAGRMAPWRYRGIRIHEQHCRYHGTWDMGRRWRQWCCRSPAGLATSLVRACCPFVFSMGRPRPNRILPTDSAIQLDEPRSSTCRSRRLDPSPRPL